MRGPSPLLPPADKSSRYVLVIIKLPDPYDSRVQHNIFIICFRLFVPIKTLEDYRERDEHRENVTTCSLPPRHRVHKYNMLPNTHW